MSNKKGGVGRHMYEDTVVRAITIGVSIFIIMMVFTLIMVYYSHAREIVKVADVDMEIETYYVREIEDRLTNKADITGSDIKNIVNYYYKSNKVQINLNDVRLMSATSKGKYYSYFNVNKYGPVSDFLNDKSYRNVILNIDPNQKYTLSVTPVEEKNMVIYTFVGNKG